MAKENLKGAELFEQITKEMLETYKAKNHDYGGSYDECIDAFGAPAGVIPLMNKVSRIKSLARKDFTPEVGESLEDSVKDLANYAVLFLMAIRENRI